MNPLTVAQVRRRRCARCGRKPGHAVWDVCADRHRLRVLCWPCDKALNRLVLRWMRFGNWRETCERYERQRERAMK